MRLTRNGIALISSLLLVVALSFLFKERARIIYQVHKLKARNGEFLLMKPVARTIEKSSLALARLY